jgi:hypothetical protein
MQYTSLGRSGFHGGAGRPTTLNPLQKALSSEMVRYWTSVSGAAWWEAWPRYDLRDERLIRLMLPTSPIVPMSRFAQEHHCDFRDATGVC